MSRIKFSDKGHDGPQMNWFLNHRCNYSCKYCFLPQTMRSKEHPLTGKYSPQHIADCFNVTHKTWWICMSGGEPFLYPDYVNLCAKLTEKHFITINTNLSTSNTIKFADIIDPGRVKSINASLHIEEREKRNGLKKYLDRVRYFQDKGFQIRVGYVMHPQLFGRVENDFRMLKDEGVEIINMKVYRGYFNSQYYPLAYTESEQEFIKSKLLDSNEAIIMSIDKTFKFFGRSCRTGMDYWLMEPTGNVRRCCSSAKSYGNLFEGSFKPDESPRPCPFIKCAAPYEGMGYTSSDNVNTSQLMSEIYREAPDYIYRKARPTKLYAYVKRVMRN